MTARTIKIDMTWTAAAQIIAAALENGTDKGRDAARAELFRMAEILDAMRQTPTRLETFDVIADGLTQPERAFGQSFATEAEATAYADKMTAAGYTAEVLPGHETVTPAEALALAADYFNDPRLSAEPEATA